MPLPGANPTIASYNASVVNFHTATGSLARFENKNILYYFEKRSFLHYILRMEKHFVEIRTQSYDFVLQRQGCKLFTTPRVA
jgi:hypothetical protein